MPIPELLLWVAGAVFFLAIAGLAGSTGVAIWKRYR